MMSPEPRPTGKLAGLLIAVGILWALVAAYIFLALSGMSVPIYPLPAILALYFGGPVVLVVGSVLVIFSRRRKLGSVLALAACAWLTIQALPDLIDALIRTQQPLEAPRTPTEILIFGSLALLVILSDISAVVLVRRTAAI